MHQLFSAPFVLSVLIRDSELHCMAGSLCPAIPHVAGLLLWNGFYDDKK